MDFSEVNTWRQKLWQLVAIGVFSAGVLSCTLSSQAEVWWNKGLDQGKFTIPIARIVNQANSPLLITDTPINLSSVSLLKITAICLPFFLVRNSKRCLKKNTNIS
ncbi:MAG: hypothetical protein EAZ60_13620 [Oscillatoriales cyanobacterium]|nr:MAG: hypothetical protein EAZ60_13620 [Oscillatoriales cyanobacterium]